MLAHHPAQIGPLSTNLYRSKSGELIAVCSIRTESTSPERLAGDLFKQLRSLAPDVSHIVADLTPSSGPLRDGVRTLVHAPSLFRTLSIVTQDGELPEGLALLGLRNCSAVRVFSDVRTALRQWELASDQPLEVPLGKLAAAPGHLSSSRSAIASASLPPRSVHAQISGTISAERSPTSLRIESSTKRLSASDTSAVKELLTTHCETLRPLYLDLSALEGVDKGVLPIFVALKKALQTKGSDLFFGQLSEKLRDTLEPLGFVRYFAAPSHKAA